MKIMAGEYVRGLSAISSYEKNKEPNIDEGLSFIDELPIHKN